MEYAAVFLLFLQLTRCAMLGLARRELPRGTFAAFALALSMCVPAGRVCVPFFVAAAIGAYALFCARDLCGFVGAAACACVFLLGGRATFAYAGTGAFALSLALSAAFSSSGADLVGRVTVGSVIADMYSLFVRSGGYLQCVAAGMHTSYYLIVSAAAAAAFDALAAARAVTEPSFSVLNEPHCAAPRRRAYAHACFCSDYRFTLREE